MSKKKISRRSRSKRGRVEGRIPFLVSDPTLSGRLCRILQVGLSLKDAATLTDVHYRQVYDWYNWGESDDPGRAPCYREFYLAAEKAKAQARSRFSLCINKAVLHEEAHHTDATCPGCGQVFRVTIVVPMPGDAKVAMQALTRSDPENYPSERMVSELRLTGAPGTMAQLQVYVPARGELPAPAGAAADIADRSR